MQRWCSARIGEGLIYDLRVALFAKVQRMPVAFFTRTQTGCAHSRLNNDVVGAQTAVTSTLGSVVSNVVVLVTTLGAMIALEWRLTLLALVVLPLFIIPAKRVGVRLQAISREQMAYNAEMNTQMTERFNVAGAQLVKLFGREQRRGRAVRRARRRVRDTGIRRRCYGRVFFVALGLVGAIGAAAIYGVGAFMVVDGTSRVGTLVALAALVTRVYQPLTGLTNARVDLMTAMVSFERVFEVLDAPEPIPDRPGAVDLVDARGAVEFDDVWFRYPPAADVTVASLEDAGLRAATPTPTSTCSEACRSRSRRARPWPSSARPASGKSTTVSLFPRLYDVTRGAVRIDGHDVRDLTLGSLRAAIGVVSQDPHLFHETIGDNLRYAKPDATDDELDEACRGGAHPRHDRRTARRLRHGRRRTWLPPEWRREAATGHRPSAVEEPGDHDPRRGHEPSRQRERGARAGSARARHGGSHSARDRPPAVDDPQRRSHRVRRERAHRRARHPRRTPRGEWPLREPTQCRGTPAPRLNRLPRRCYWTSHELTA